MPELPDITVYIERLEKLLLHQVLKKITVINPFFVRTFDPPVQAIANQTIETIERLGKRIVFKFGNGLYAVIHLMISGRLQWRTSDGKMNRKLDLALFDFPEGRLVVTEVASKKRASLHVFENKAGLKSIDPGGQELAQISLSEFKKCITKENHTLKRTLTDPRILSGIGNAYSDEILHAAKLSPILQTQKMSDDEIERLFNTIPVILDIWTEKLRNEAGDNLPRKVTAFHDDMAAHGKFGKPCPVCGTTIQRIRYAANETNYCPACQTAGKLLADRSLSRLLKKDWPKTAEELDEIFSVKK